MDIKTKGTPEAVAVDGQGNVYVTDYDLGRLQVFDNNGQFLWAWGGREMLFKRPVGIAFDANRHIYIVGQRSRIVQVFNLP